MSMSFDRTEGSGMDPRESRQSMTDVGGRMLLVIGLFAASILPAFAIDARQTPFAAGKTIGMGGAHACVIRSDGTLACWGSTHDGIDQPPPGRFVTVESGRTTSCAIASDGEAVCWGKVPAPVLPAGPWRALAMGGWDNICGIRSEGRMECWGAASSFIRAAPIGGRYRSVSVNEWQVCAIRDDGKLQCWSSSWGVDRSPAVPEGRYVQLDLGASHACALGADGSIACWSGNGQIEAPSGTGFKAVSAGDTHSCAIRDNGTVSCWGGNEYGQSNAPQGSFTEISAGDSDTCARRIDGRIECWGEGHSLPYRRDHLRAPLERVEVGSSGGICALDDDGEPLCAHDDEALLPPMGRYQDLSLGSNGGCGVKRDGGVICWGGFPAPPVGLDEDFVAVSAGESHVCGLRAGGEIACWGEDHSGSTQPPSGVFTKLVSGDRFSCALRRDGGIACWGEGEAVSEAPQGTGYIHVTAGGDKACASNPNGMIRCWGADAPWLRNIATFWTRDIEVGRNFACILLGGGVDGGSLYCVGKDGYGVPSFPEAAYSMIGVGDDVVCALNDRGTVLCRGSKRLELAADAFRLGHGVVASGAAHGCSLGSHGVIACWGDDSHGQRSAPAIRAGSIALDADHGCAAGSDGRLRCWGDDRHGGSTPTTSSVRTFDVGQFNGCAISDGGTASCWGWNENGQGTPPSGTFAAVATALNHSCGLRGDGSLACWGYGVDGQTTAPSGEFIAVDVGERHSCALSIEGELHCWGLGGEGQTRPPQGAFRNFAAGAFHNCGIRMDGTLACWGRNRDGQALPPTGRYIAVSAGFDHSCAIRDDGGRECWGGNAAGQAPRILIMPATLPSGALQQPYAAALHMTSSQGYVPVRPRFRLLDGKLPPGITLDADGALQGEPVGWGHYDVAVEARDDHGFVASAVYRLSIEGPPGPDTTPPEVEPILTGTKGNHAWYRGDVRVRWRVSDPQSAIVSTAGCGEQVVTQDTAGTDITCTAISTGGTSKITTRVHRDIAPPSFGETRTPQPNAAGWNNTDVVLHYDCSDNASGLATACPAGRTFTQEGREQFFFPQPDGLRDHAGNYRGGSSVRVSIDRTAPQLTATMPPAQLVQNATHDFRLGASDVLSGIASASCTPVDTATLGAKLATCTVTDKAGNVTTQDSAYEVVPKRMNTGGPQRPELSPSRIPRPSPALRPRRGRR